jgi:hypothetical protein
MSLKALVFSIGCVIAWFVLLPILVIGGGMALLIHAIFGELMAFITGHADLSIDRSMAREIARRMCGGYGGRARANWRNPVR